MKNKVRHYTIEELHIEIPIVKEKWKELKTKEKFKIPKYTDDRIEELELLINSEIPSLIKEMKGSNIINEVINLHFENCVDLEFILDFSPTSNRINYFIEYNHLLNDSEYWRYLRYCYSTHDYNPVPNPILVTLFSAKRQNKEAIMNEEDLKCFKSLPEKFIIFRGMSKGEFDDGKFGISWTLEEKIANDFATRNEIIYKEEHFVHKIEVEKKDILAYFSERKEKEIIYLKK